MAPTDTEFDIGISAEGEPLGAIAEDFGTDLRALGLTVASEPRPSGAMLASLDWVIPTAIALFIANKYLGTLLEEAAKDHYPQLKAAFLKLARRTTGPSREVRVTVIATSSAKIADVDPAALSVWTQLRDSRRVVFRFDQALPALEMEAIVDEMFTLLLSHYRSQGQSDLLSRAPTAIPMSRWAPVVMRFDPSVGRWRCWVIGPNGQGSLWLDEPN